MSDDLETLFPASLEVLAKGEKIIISPFFFGQFPKVMGLIKQISEKITNLNLINIKSDGKTINFTANPDWVMHLPEVMESAGEPWISLLMLATKKTREWFDTLAFDEGLALSKALIEVNYDFFARKVLPMLPAQPAQAVEGAPKTTEENGAQLSQPLEATDTEQTTSS